MKFTITKVKLVKRETLEIGIEKAEGGKRSEDFKDLVHDDLKTAIDNLRIHFALLVGYVTPKQIKDIETPPEDLVADIHVHGYTYGAGDENWVIITGHRVLPTGKAVNINTPMTRYEENEKSAYVFLDDLKEKIERVDKEVRMYMAKEKLGKTAQMSMDFNKKEPVTKLLIANPPSIEEKAQAMAKEKLDRENVKADGEVAVYGLDGARIKTAQANGVSDVAAELVAEVNGKQAKAQKLKRTKQTPDNPSGIIAE